LFAHIRSCSRWGYGNKLLSRFLLLYYFAFTNKRVSTVAAAAKKKKLKEFFSHIHARLKKVYKFCSFFFAFPPDNKSHKRRISDKKVSEREREKENCSKLFCFSIVSFIFRIVVVVVVFPHSLFTEIFHSREKKKKNYVICFPEQSLA
jgi:hypothetical protein